MGDGAFVWGCPTAFLWSAKAYQAPFLAVVYDNQAYGAIKGLVQRAYGEEKLTVQKGFECGVDFIAPPDYAAIAQANGAFGVRVEQPKDILPALREGLKRVRGGQTAVVDVRVG